MSTYAERQAYRDAHPGVIVDNNSSSDGGFTSSTPDGTPSVAAQTVAHGGSNGGGGGGQQQQQQQQQSSGDAALGAIENRILAAIGSGNKAAADEAAKEFAMTFGLDTDKFQESVRQYNQNFTLAQAGITGTLDGNPTLAAQKQSADLTGYVPGSTQYGKALGNGWYLGAPGASQGSPGDYYYVGTDGKIYAQNAGGGQNMSPDAFTGRIAPNGLAPGTQASTMNELTGAAQSTNGLPPGATPTEAARQFNTTTAENARQFDVTQANTALDNANKTALGVLTLTAGLHADPFRQLNVMYGANGVSGLNQAVQGLTSQYGLPGSFTAPAGSNSANLGGLVNQFNNAGTGPTGAQLAAGTGLNNTNQIIARNYNAAPQNVKDATTSALSMNTGADQTSVDKAIQNNLPKFTSPDFGLASV